MKLEFKYSEIPIEVGKDWDADYDITPEYIISLEHKGVTVEIKEVEYTDMVNLIHQINDTLKKDRLGIL